MDEVVWYLGAVAAFVSDGGGSADGRGTGGYVGIGRSRLRWCGRPPALLNLRLHLPEEQDRFRSARHFYKAVIYVRQRIERPG